MNSCDDECSVLGKQTKNTKANDTSENDLVAHRQGSLFDDFDINRGCVGPDAETQMLYDSQHSPDISTTAAVSKSAVR